MGRIAASGGENDVRTGGGCIRDYYMGVYEVTQEQWSTITGSSGSPYFTYAIDRSLRPMEQVTYESIRGKASEGYDWPVNGHAVSPTSFMGKLRALTGLGFDLPTDAEWEFACRAGTGTALNNGQELSDMDFSDSLDAIARYGKTGISEMLNANNVPANTAADAGGTARVGSYEPNAWGLYDMLGNVVEWCLDWYVVDSYNYSALTGPTTGTARSLRGGSWLNAAYNCRSAYRDQGSPHGAYKGFGFRVSLPLPAVP